MIEITLEEYESKGVMPGAGETILVSPGYWARVNRTFHPLLFNPLIKLKEDYGIDPDVTIRQVVNFDNDPLEGLGCWRCFDHVEDEFGLCNDCRSILKGETDA